MTVAPAETRQAAKARGAFYTPPQLTRFLAGWAVRSPDDRVLEPSAGDGAFLEPVLRRLAELGKAGADENIVAVEREPAEAAKLRATAPGADIRAVDFFDLDPAALTTVAAVVGNPPYIRYHGFTGKTRESALARARSQGVELTNLASSWAHFVVHASGFLGEGGRLALVLPSELLHTDYAGPVRTFLTSRFRSVTVIAFDRAVFDSAQVDAVLLLASDDAPGGFQVIRLHDADELVGLDIGSASVGKPSERRWSASVDADVGRLYEDLIASGSYVRLGELAEVDIGFVSGATDYFVLTPEQAAQHALPGEVLTPAVRRPRDVPSLTVRPEEVSFLLDTNGYEQDDAAVSRYLALGKRTGVPSRYKCRNRVPWHRVPLPKRMPDAFLPYMHHLAPRLIVNGLGVRNTNLLHGVALAADAPPVEALSVAMCSSATLLSAELEGRAYGGGVLKLETKEAERLLVPVMPNTAAPAGALPVVDALVRAGGIEAASAFVDDLIGLPHEQAWAAYVVMRDRRLGRRRVRSG